jgi:hypothetical protein
MARLTEIHRQHMHRATGVNQPNVPQVSHLKFKPLPCYMEKFQKDAYPT